MATVQEAIRRLRIEATTQGVAEATGQLNQLEKAQGGVAVASDNTGRATLALDQKFASIERRYVAGVRAQQEFAKTQKLVNAAVAQNPALTERANAVLAAAAERHGELTKAANDNAEGLRLVSIESIAVATHLKAAAAAAYTLSPAFRALANPAIATSLSTTGTVLGALGPVAAAVTTSLLGRLLPALALISRVALPISLVVQAMEAMNAVAELGAAKLKELTDLSAAAGGAGVSTDFFQRQTESAKRFNIEADLAAQALKRFKELSADKLGGSEFGNRVGELARFGNFSGNPGVDALKNAATTEERYRAVVALITEAMQKGERLAALDLAAKFMPPELVERLRANGELLRDMQKAADAIKQTNLISAEDIGYANELARRLKDAEQTIAKGLQPLQKDLTQLGLNYQESWVVITEVMARGVTIANELYRVLKGVPGVLQDAGNNPIWDKITKATEQLRLNARPEGLVLKGEPGFDQNVGSGSASRARLGAMLNDANAVRRAMQDVNDIQSKVFGDASKPPPSPSAAAKITQDTTDAVDRALNSLNRHILQQEADAKAVGLGARALAEYRAEAAFTAAVQANGGKATAEQVAQFEKLKVAAGEAAEALARARIIDQIKFERETLLLSPENVQIAQQLRGLYPDIATALGSAEANAMRMNNTMRGIRDVVLQSAKGFASDLVSGLMRGKSLMDSLADAAKNLSNSLAQGALQSLFSGNFAMAAIQGIGALISGIFASGQERRRREEEARQREQEAAEAARERAIELQYRQLMIGRDPSNNLNDALVQFAIEADRQRREEARQDNRNIVELEKTLALERQQIIDDFARRAIEAERQKQQELLQVQADYQDRILASDANGGGVTAQLVQFERRAQRERAEEAARGNQHLALLERTLGAERAAILRESQTASIEAAQSEVDQARSNLEQAYERERDALTQTISRLNSFVDALRRFREGLLLNRELSILSPQQRLMEAQRQFRQTAALAQSGDEDALQRLPDISQQYLDEARSFHASTEDYYRAFMEVQGVIEQTEALTRSQISVAQQQLNALNLQVTGLITINTSILSVRDAIAALQLAQQNLTNVQNQGGGGDTPTSQVSALYRDILGRAPDASGAAYWQAEVDAGLSASLIAQHFVAAAIANGESVNPVWRALYGMRNGGIVGMMASGGIVGNGMMNVDSVMARYAGGGFIGLAGGEHVMPQPQTQMYRPQLEAMRAGRWPASNDNRSDEIKTIVTSVVKTMAGVSMTEMQACKAENAALRAQMDRLIRATEANKPKPAKPGTAKAAA